MSYDRTEAKAIFARSHEKRDPIMHYRGREEAAHALLEAVVLAAKEAGYDVGPERGMQVISHHRQGAVYLWVADNVLCLGTADGKRKELPIEYDAALGMFVGKDDDEFYVPEPGKPKQRRSAVAALAEVVVEMIDEQAAARRTGR